MVTMYSANSECVFCSQMFGLMFYVSEFRARNNGSILSIPEVPTFLHIHTSHVYLDVTSLISVFWAAVAL